MPKKEICMLAYMHVHTFSTPYCYGSTMKEWFFIPGGKYITYFSPN
jgi:hypothetical protein